MQFSYQINPTQGSSSSNLQHSPSGNKPQQQEQTTFVTYSSELLSQTSSGDNHHYSDNNYHYLVKIIKESKRKSEFKIVDPSQDKPKKKHSKRSCTNALERRVSLVQSAKKTTVLTEATEQTTVLTQTTEQSTGLGEATNLKIIETASLTLNSEQLTPNQLDQSNTSEVLPSIDDIFSQPLILTQELNPLKLLPSFDLMFGDIVKSFPARKLPVIDVETNQGVAGHQL